MAAEPRTSNGNENYHSVLRKAVPLNATIWALIDALKDTEVKTARIRLEDMMTKMPGPQLEENGLPVKQANGRKERTSMNDYNRRCLLSRFDDMTPVDFLHQAANDLIFEV